MSENSSNSNPLRVLVCGSRGWIDCEAIRREFLKLEGEVTVIHGAAKGADTMAGEIAAELGFRVIACPADWKRYGRGAGLIRNKQMLTEERPDLVLAFPRSLAHSPGTRHMIELARQAGVEVRVFEEEAGDEQSSESTTVDGRRIIAFTKVCLPFGWLGNMSPHTVWHKAVEWRTAEALFQSLRFDDEAIQNEIWERTSPMSAKMASKKHKAARVIEPMGEQDVENMGLVLMLKVDQHPEIRRMLPETGDAEIIEDCSGRKDKRSLFWGAASVDGEWHGSNTLGKLWMELREEVRRGEW